MADLMFIQSRNGDWTMIASYPVGPDETGSSSFRYVREQPANVAKITGKYHDNTGREITTGTVIMNGVGIGHAWPTPAMISS